MSLCQQALHDTRVTNNSSSESNIMESLTTIPMCLLLLLEDDLVAFLLGALHGHLADGGESVTSEMERRGVRVHYETRWAAIRCMRIIGRPEAILAAFPLFQRTVTQPALREWGFGIEAYVRNKRTKIEQRPNNMTISVCGQRVMLHLDQPWDLGTINVLLYNFDLVFVNVLCTVLSF